MADWYEEAKALVLPYRELIIRLVADFVHLRGLQLRAELNNHKANIGKVWLALFVLSLVCTIVGLYVNPLTRPTGDIATTLRQIAFAGSALWIPSIVPMYLAIRLFGGSRCFWFLLVVNQIAAFLNCAAMPLTVVPGVYLSAQLAGDIEDVREGRGRNTPFYHLWCQPAEQSVSVLSEQVELNNLTGKYDLLERLRNLPPQSAAGFSLIKQYNARIAKLPADTKSRVAKLTAEIDAREFTPIEHRDPIEDMAFERYWPMFIGFLIYLLVGVTLGVWALIVVYRGVIGAGASRRMRWVAALRVTMGFVSSLAFLFLFITLNAGWQFSTHYDDLKLRTLNAEASARQSQTICGRIDPRGLW